MKWLFRLLRRQRDNIRITDEVILEHIRGGKVVDRRVLKGNLITSAGKAAVAYLIGSETPDPFTWLAVGTDPTGEDIADTTLGAEITTNGLERAAGTVSRITTTVANDTMQILHTWTATAAHLVREVGVFDQDAPGGEMLNHKTFALITLANTDQLKLTVKFPITAA
ncbi:unnamed protein product [marine sediment metagenome]|uniref:Uncharacterized protein n=1 Tax=marine sediment metagenome TaxID=412755 RepID=X1VFB8_9ZZZZ